jgi:hypothetical protein
MEYLGRNSNAEFIEQYGKDAFVQIFDCANGKKTERVDLLYKDSADKYNITFEGLCLLDGLIVVEFSIGDYIPNEILYFGDHVPQHVPKEWQRQIKLNRFFKDSTIDKHPQ